MHNCIKARNATIMKVTVNARTKEIEKKKKNQNLKRKKGRKSSMEKKKGHKSVRERARANL